ncbi:uncharacterized protein LOC111041045 [Myzus persicae]|uniref:uncharacterized protein LOC111041045 n=1 Tax=Myzus persicae TaxID=13164 RepID=UPI000B937D3F|nr:uncharacterized protein LOC111041045 [Myzus persicae]
MPITNSFNHEVECAEKRQHTFSSDIEQNTIRPEILDEQRQYSNVSNDDIEINSYSFESELAQWALHFKITHTALNGILTILKKHECFSCLPKDARTLLKTKSVECNSIKKVNPGTYYHFGIENGIIRHFLDSISNEEIKLVVGIDGLPISKSSSTQFWPILAYIRSISNHVFPIGVYCGTQKPNDSNDYLKDFVIEAEQLILNGIFINGKFYKVVLDVVCCDVPAKSFVLKIKGHNGFYSCTRCKIEGEYIEKRLCFPYSEPSNRPPERTHHDYVQRTQISHHVYSNNSCLVEIPRFDIVKGFSLDYMHLVCLGVVKKLLMLWMKGPLSVRLPSWKINQLSELIVNLKPAFVCEFSRKPRTLIEVARWKATEFRSFLLYIGPIVLDKVLSDHCFKNFKALSVAMTILLTPGLSEFVQYARDLLEYFVKSFEQIYGQHLVSSNIHGLIHLVDDYQRYGPLDLCCAFPFENYMKVLKTMLRKPDKPLQQIVKRYHERSNLVMQPTKTKPKTYIILGSHNRGPLVDNITINPQYSTLVKDNFKIKSKIDAESYFCTNNNDIIKLVNIAHLKETGEAVLIGKKFIQKKDFYNQPIRSSLLNIYEVQQLSDDFDYWHISDIKNKVLIFPRNSNLIAIPLLHTVL